VPAKQSAAGSGFTRRDLIQALNGDLAREYQAIIAYVVYAETLKGPQYMHIAGELKKHAAEELSHAQTISRQIAYLGGSPTTKPLPVKETEDSKAMLRADLDNERETIRQYRRRVRQCEELGELAMAESIREILRQEQDHLIELAEALAIDPPDPGIA
jgi:bacterioferritin